MKLLVTGANGFIGQHLCRELRALGIEPITCSRYPDNAETSVDLLCQASVRSWLEVLQPTHCVHLAWLTTPGQFWSHIDNIHWHRASVHLAQVFYEQGGQHFIGVGSCAEQLYKGSSTQEFSPYAQDSLYGLCKAATFHGICALNKRHSQPFSWARVFFPFGPGEPEQKLIPSLVNVYLGHAPAFKLNAKGLRDFIYVEDVVRALVQIIKHGGSDIYDIAYSDPVSVESLVEWVGDILEKDPKSILELAEHSEPKHARIQGDNQALLDIGWQPRFTTRQALHHYLHTIQEESVVYDQ